MPKGFGWPVLVNRQVRQCPLLAYRVLDCDDANGAQQTSVRVKGVRVVPGSSLARIRTVESQVRVGSVNAPASEAAVRRPRANDGNRSVCRRSSRPVPMTALAELFALTVRQVSGYSSRLDGCFLESSSGSFGPILLKNSLLS